MSTNQNSQDRSGEGMTIITQTIILFPQFFHGKRQPNTIVNLQLSYFLPQQALLISNEFILPFYYPVHWISFASPTSAPISLPLPPVVFIIFLCLFIFLFFIFV